MASGQMKLSREDYRKLKYDLTKLFLDDSTRMERINQILAKSVVPDEHLCLKSASELLTLVDEMIQRLQTSDDRILPNGRLDLSCLMCGKGKYKDRGMIFSVPQSGPNMMVHSSALLRPFACDVCTHHIFLAPGLP
jgi:hypothetical protein